MFSPTGDVRSPLLLLGQDQFTLALLWNSRHLMSIVTRRRHTMTWWALPLDVSTQSLQSFKYKLMLRQNNNIHLFSDKIHRCDSWPTSLNCVGHCVNERWLSWQQLNFVKRIAVAIPRLWSSAVSKLCLLRYVRFWLSLHSHGPRLQHSLCVECDTTGSVEMLVSWTTPLAQPLCRFRYEGSSCLESLMDNAVGNGHVLWRSPKMETLDL